MGANTPCLPALISGLGKVREWRQEHVLVSFFFFFFNSLQTRVSWEETTRNLLSFDWTAGRFLVDGGCGRGQAHRTWYHSWAGVRKQAKQASS